MGERHFSVYERGTDKPIFIYGTIEECSKSLGILPISFHKMLSRAKRGKTSKRYEIYEEK